MTAKKPTFATLSQDPEIKKLVQENVLQRAFNDALFPRLLFNADLALVMHHERAHWVPNWGRPEITQQTACGVFLANTDNDVRGGRLDNVTCADCRAHAVAARLREDPGG